MVKGTTQRVVVVRAKGGALFDEAIFLIRPGMEQEAVNRAQEVYGEKYSPLLMFDSKKTVSRMLHEDMERRAVQRMVRQAQKGRQTFYKKKIEQKR